MALCFHSPSGLAGSDGYSVFETQSDCFLKQLPCFPFPPAMEESSAVLVLANTCYCQSLSLAILVGGTWDHAVGLMCVSPATAGVERLTYTGVHRQVGFHFLPCIPTCPQ